MKRKLSISLLTILMLYGLISVQASAHLMVAQHGTLNIIDNNAFMVLSLPISGFENIDDNNNGEISMIEFNSHRAAITFQVRKHIKMRDEQGNIVLEEIILSPVISHDDESQSISQLTILGKFNLRNNSDNLVFQADIYGKAETEKHLALTAKRKAKSQIQTFELTPNASSKALFPLEQH